VAGTGLDKDAWEKIFMCMLAGKLKENPFTEIQIQKGKVFLTEWCKSMGVPPAAREGDLKQEPELRLLQAFLKVCGDPDAEAVDLYCKGVRLGHKLRMPRTPAVYEAKARWRIKYEGTATKSDERGTER
jgi:hypothetical protein